MSIGRRAPRSHAGTHLHVLDLHLVGQGFICVDSAEVLWENELGAWEDVLCNDTSHICSSSVEGTSWVKQKWMKLFFEVKEET